MSAAERPQALINLMDRIASPHCLSIAKAVHDETIPHQIDLPLSETVHAGVVCVMHVVVNGVQAAALTSVQSNWAARAAIS